MEIYKFQREITAASGVQRGYVYADSLEEAKKKLEEDDFYLEHEEFEAKELDVPIWDDENK
jgi:hypothetical protein